MAKEKRTPEDKANEKINELKGMVRKQRKQIVALQKEKEKLLNRLNKLKDGKEPKPRKKAIKPKIDSIEDLKQRMRETYCQGKKTDD